MRRSTLLAITSAAAVIGTAIAAVPVLADGHTGGAATAQGETGMTQVGVTPDDLLVPYYTALKSQIDLPVAPANASLAPDTAITRLAFGSCNHQSRSQEYWNVIAGDNPQAFLFIGDNNYGDQGWDGDPSLPTLRAAYTKQAATPELASFRAQVPMMITWDDHDYGMNDAGGNFAYRQWSETLFETFWGSTSEVQSRPGIYDSRMVGPEGQRTQIILLDTRYFRSPMNRMGYTPERPPLGVYLPNEDPAATMLGAQQWEWLKVELAKPADFRIIASSIQVLTDAHNYEGWLNFPLEREKLYMMLAGREDSGMVLLSGDRHAGGIYTEAPEAAGGETLWELTSSSLNFSFSTTERNTAREPDARRVTDFISEENYGLIDIDWKARTFTMTMNGNTGEEIVTRTVEW